MRSMVPATHVAAFTSIVRATSKARKAAPAIVRGRNQTTGVALVEVFALD